MYVIELTSVEEVETSIPSLGGRGPFRCGNGLSGQPEVEARRVRPPGAAFLGGGT